MESANKKVYYLTVSSVDNKLHLIESRKIQEIKSKVKEERSYFSCKGRCLQASSEMDRLQAGMKTAMRDYHTAAKQGLDRGPFLVASNVSLMTFEAWAANIESCWRIAYIDHDGVGSVFLYGDPSILHDSVTRWVDSLIQEQVTKTGLSMRNLVRMMGSGKQKFPNGFKEPDSAYTTLSMRPPCIPRVCFEVAYKNEDIDKLYDEVKKWHQQGVVLSIGIKVLVKQHGPKGKKKLNISMFWIEQRKLDKKPRILEFSPNVCGESNMSDFVVTFPFSSFTTDVDCTADFPIIVNLFELQQHILLEIFNEAEENHSVIYVDENQDFCMEEDIASCVYVDENQDFCMEEDIASCATCKGAYNEQMMIQCGDPDCSQWYHAKCVSLEEDELPTVWFCPICIQKIE